MHDPQDEDHQNAPPFSELLQMEQQERLLEPGDTDEAFMDAEAGQGQDGSS